MAMTDFKKSEFRFSETFNNASGKTSGSGMVGVFMGLTATLSFLVAMVGWLIGIDGVLEVMDKILQMGLLSAALMGVRKIFSSLSSNNGSTQFKSSEVKDEKEV